MIIIELCGTAVGIVLLMACVRVAMDLQWKRRAARRARLDPGNMTEDEVAALIDGYSW